MLEKTFNRLIIKDNIDLFLIQREVNPVIDPLWIYIKLKVCIKNNVYGIHGVYAIIIENRKIK